MTYLDEGFPSSRTTISSCVASNPCSSRRCWWFCDEQEIIRDALSVVVRDSRKEHVSIQFDEEFWSTPNVDVVWYISIPYPRMVWIIQKFGQDKKIRKICPFGRITTTNSYSNFIRVDNQKNHYQFPQSIFLKNISALAFSQLGRMMCFFLCGGCESLGDVSVEFWSIFALRSRQLCTIW